ncbi:MAG: hypothetical protein RL542_1658 [Bacteroidota bacterium]|jgi:hypothetical protein
MNGFENKYEDDFLQLKARFNTLVKPQHIEGYIFSFFDYFDKKTNQYNNGLKKEIITLNDSCISFYSQRDSNLYDVENNVITLHSKEVELINKSHFVNEILYLYQGLILDLETFYFNYYRQNPFFVKEKLQIIKNFIYDDISRYRSGKVSNINLINTTFFKDFILRENNKIISSIDQKLEYLTGLTDNPPNPSEPAWKKVAKLFASGEIRVVNEKGIGAMYFFKDENFTKINKMSHYIEETLSLKVDSLRPYISDTISGNKNKTIFQSKNFKELQQIKAELIVAKKKVNPFYNSCLKKLSEQIY